MPEYRIFLLKEDRGIAKPSVLVMCTNDQEAVDKARQIANGLDVEIWEGSRNIVRGSRPSGPKGRFYWPPHHFRRNK